MSITDELREYTEEQIRWLDMTKVHYRKLFAIADRIDAEHEEAIQQALIGEGSVPATDENMAEHGWVRLPVDADGEYIRIGDALTDDAKFKSEGKVMRLMLEDEDWMVGFGCGGWTEPSIHEWHHYHAPTVEDVLLELLDEAEHFHSLEEEREAIAEYAAKLRLAGDAE